MKPSEHTFARVAETGHTRDERRQEAEHSPLLMLAFGQDVARYPQ
jgi:hypothetical protein